MTYPGTGRMARPEGQKEQRRVADPPAGWYSGNCQDKDFYDARTPRAAGFETGFYKGGLGLDGVGDRAVGCEAGGGQ